MVEGTSLGSLHARLDEVEPGLFRAVYVEGEDRGVDAVPIPDAHIGTTREGVRMWVEQMAAHSGDRDVIWD